MTVGRDPNDTPLSTLCRGCGLCCDGSLFSHVGLEPEDLARLRARGIATRVRSSGTEVLPQRCAALEGYECQIYPDRPRSCATYRCMLAAALVEKEVTLDEARAEVTRAHRLIAEGHARRFLRRRFRGRAGLD